MIHSLSGGVAKEYNIYDYAKVETKLGVFFFISDISSLKVGDVVEVCVKNQTVEGKVLSIDKNVSEQNFPISAKKLKKILKVKN